MMAVHLQSLAQLAAGRLINSVVEGIAIVLLASVLLRFIGRNSGTRFAVWFSTLVAIAGLSVFAVGSGHSEAISSASEHITLPSSWALVALILWAAIAFIGLVRIAFAVRQVRLLRRRSTPIAPAQLNPQANKIWQEFCRSRQTDVRVSDELHVPTAIGFFRPAVLIPRWAITDLSPEELDAVLLHELGHLLRWDDWTNLAQKALRALLFFHPAVWWIDVRLSLERESACDDLVLARTSNTRGYAECLVSVAEKSLLRTGMALALAAVSRVRQTAIRLARILDSSRVVETRLSKPALAVVSTLSLAALAVLPRTPELVVFQDVAPKAHIAHVTQAPVATVPVAYHSQATAHVVQAVLHEDAARGTTQPTPIRNSRARYSKTKLSRTNGRAIQPRLVRASAAQDQELRSILLFVVQTSEFDGTEGIIPSVHVWTLIVIQQQRPIAVQNASAWKSI
jgi:beta-lactamase regulating signal transducer with metallopeptidase domain